MALDQQKVKLKWLFVFGVLAWFLKALKRRIKAQKLLAMSGDGKVCVITGAASGIGKATTMLMAKKGWTIYAVDVNEKALEDLSQEAEKEGWKVESIVCNLAKIDDCKRLLDIVAKSVAAEKGIDSLINCAGVAISAPTVGVSFAQMDLQYKVNVLAPAYLSKLFLDLLLVGKNGGTLVNVSSVGGLFAWPWQGVYASTKYALEGFSDTLRREALSSGLNLRVCLVEPGGADTPLADVIPNNLKKWLDENPENHFAPGLRQSAKRLNDSKKFMSSGNRALLVSPESVAEAILLASTDSVPQHRYYVAAPVFHVVFCTLYYLPSCISDSLSTYIC